MDLGAHLDRLAELLAAERVEEERRFGEEAAQLPAAEREARGLLLRDLEPVDETALGGRPLVRYARAGGQLLPPGPMGPGSLVRLHRRQATPEAEPPTAVVARRTQRELDLVFEEEPPAWVSAGRVQLELRPSAVTHERLQRAVRGLREDPAARRWHGPLLGQPLRFRERPREAPGPAAALNPEQQEAVALCERAEDLALVHGPPGTGKTTVLCEVVRRAAARGEVVLCAAPSNLAVDNLIERLADLGLRTVRLGHPARVLPALQERTLEAQARAHPDARLARDLLDEAVSLRREAAKGARRRAADRFAGARAQRQEARALWSEAQALLRRAEAAVLADAQVVLATLTGLSERTLGARRFDLAVIDEATQALEPAAYGALLRAGRAVLAGDHRQLPPTVLSLAAQQGGLGRSLFERLLGLHGEAIQVTLREQHRMHERIMRYPSEALYGGALRAHPRVAGWTLPGDDAPLVFIDTAGRGFSEEEHPGGSRDNPGEAQLCAEQVEALLQAGAAPGEVAVIAPYEAQVQRLRQLLLTHLEAGIEIDTVDGFQGREKDAVVLSLVRSSDAGDVGFLSDVRRMNVALTRARKKLIVVGDSATVARHPFYEGFVRYAQEVGAWRSAWEFG